VFSNVGLAALLVVAGSALASAQDATKVVVGDSSQFLISYGYSYDVNSLASVAPVVSQPALSSTGGGGTPTGTWITALNGNFDASRSSNSGLIVSTSAVTAVLSGDGTFATADGGSLILNFGGVQARVLVDCALPACDATSDTVPAANLLNPGVITLDQAAHFLASGADATTLRVALDLAAGARAFNFYKAGIAAQHKKHTVLFQVKLNAGAFALGYQSATASAAVVAVAKRTMIMEAINLDSHDR